MMMLMMVMTTIVKRRSDVGLCLSGFVRSWNESVKQLYNVTKSASLKWSTLISFPRTSPTILIFNLSFFISLPVLSVTALYNFSLVWQCLEEPLLSCLPVCLLLNTVKLIFLSLNLTILCLKFLAILYVIILELWKCWYLHHYFCDLISSSDNGLANKHSQFYSIILCLQLKLDNTQREQTSGNGSNLNQSDFWVNPRSGVCRSSQNLVDSCHCRRQSFHRVVWKVASDLWFHITTFNFPH